MPDAAFFVTTGFQGGKVVGGVAHMTVNMQAWVTVDGERELEEVDPTTVRFKYRKPQGETATLVYGTDADVKKDTTGDYHVDVLLDQPGAWTFRWEAAGDYVQASERQLVVHETEFA
jgi:hypothetical protein